MSRLASLSGDELLALMKRLNAAERTLSVHALAQLSEIQRRKLYEDAGYSSMFTYCVGELGYSEANAYRRLQAVEAVRKFPEALLLIKNGGMTICALSLIAKHLTPENCGELLKRAEGKSVRAVERLVAELAPRPDSRDIIRSLPVPSAPPALPAPPERIPALGGRISAAVDPCVERPASIQTEPLATASPVFSRPLQKITPLAPDRVHFSFTGSEELRRVVARCGELLWHRHPSGRLEDIILELGRAYLRLNDPELLPPSKPKAPRAVETRAIPRWVKSTVYRRDEGRCVFRSVEGRRCEARHGLEYDHVKPWAHGGRSDSPDNIRLLCRAHNQWAARAAGLA